MSGKRRSRVGAAAIIGAWVPIREFNFPATGPFHISRPTGKDCHDRRRQLHVDIVLVEF